MSEIAKRNMLKGLTILNWGVPDKEDAEIEALFDNRTIRVRGKEAWEIVNRRNMALSMLEMANKVKRNKKKGVDVDDIVLPYALKQAEKIWSILKLQG